MSAYSDLTCNVLDWVSLAPTFGASGVWLADSEEILGNEVLLTG